MAMLSDKYIAGFLDADGSISIRWGWKQKGNPDCDRVAQVIVKFSQKESRRIVLDKIQEKYGGYLNEYIIKGKSYWHLTIAGSTAIAMINKIGKFLVIKRRYAFYLIELDRLEATKDKVVEIKKELKHERQVRSIPIPKHPTRGWMAGYIDGDGNFSARVRRYDHGVSSAEIKLRIVCSDYDNEGILIIQKNFGGSIYHVSKTRRHLQDLHITMPPSKLKQIYDYIGKHLLLKKNELLFLKGCADMGHFRDGEYIKQTLANLKINQQRLSDSSQNVDNLLKDVKNLPRNYWCNDKRQSTLEKSK